MTSNPIVIFNVVICTLIVIRLALYHNDKPNNIWYSLLAWVFICAYGSVPVRFFFGEYPATIHWSGIVINGFICAAVFAARGNIMQLFRVLKPSCQPQ